MRHLWNWLLRDPIPVWRPLPPSDEQPVFFMTGPEMVKRIVRAIELGQSVVLAGPRGSGKSRCVMDAIKAAQKNNIIIDKDAWSFLQGNREIARDYLIEDEITFKTEDALPGAQARVIPERRSSPLFRFADRDKDGWPIEQTTIDGNRIVKITITKGSETKHQRFVLFLDEINRFSDGVLDSLLSILEEKKAVLAGRTYTIPVVVLMTMNPPGYDATARRLSPPLAARISRSYRLFTPDLDTLCDRIIFSRLEEEKSRHGHKLNFMQPSAQLLRKLSLVTLCLWGLPPEPAKPSSNGAEDETEDRAPAKPGMEYLTPDTRRLLRRLAEEDPELEQAMRQLPSLCHFGPDGRAGGDWLVSAIGMAMADPPAGGGVTGADLPNEYLHRTIVESVSHKIYDAFSPATRPDLTAKKERLIQTIGRAILDKDASYYRALTDAPSVIRTIDMDSFGDVDLMNIFLDQETMEKRLATMGASDQDPDPVRRLRALFIRAEITDDASVQAWVTALIKSVNCSTTTELQKLMFYSGLLQSNEMAATFAQTLYQRSTKNGEEIKQEDLNDVGVSQLAWARQQFHDLGDKISGVNSLLKNTVLSRFDEIQKAVAGRVIPPFDHAFASFEVTRLLGNTPPNLGNTQWFVNECGSAAKTRDEALCLATCASYLWTLVPSPELRAAFGLLNGNGKQNRDEKLKSEVVTHKDWIDKKWVGVKKVPTHLEATLVAMVNELGKWIEWRGGRAAKVHLKILEELKERWGGG